MNHSRPPIPRKSIYFPEARNYRLTIAIFVAINKAMVHGNSTRYTAMSAVYWVRFDNGQMLSVSSADARSMKRADLRAAYRKARDKAKVKMAKTDRAAKVIAVNCVG
jgi:hypothetical protein